MLLGMNGDKTAVFLADASQTLIKFASAHPLFLTATKAAQMNLRSGT